MAWSSGDTRRDRCLLVMGKTGNGKSTVGNAILGERKFQVKAGMASKPGGPLTEQVVSNEHFRQLKVVIVEDIVNQTHDEYTRRKEVDSWRMLNPHAVILAIKSDGRYTREEFELYRKVKEYWPEVTQRLVVAFTFGENCGDIETELNNASPELKEVLSDASHRYCVFGRGRQLVEKCRHRLELHSIVDRIAHVTGGATWTGTASYAPHPPTTSTGSSLYPGLPASGSSHSGGSFSGTGTFTATASAMTSSAGSSQQAKPFRILIIGKTGSGKSMVGNTLLGSYKFPKRFYDPRKTETTKEQAEEVTLGNSRQLQVIDTPDLQSQNPQAEVLKWKDAMNHAVPDIILLCVTADCSHSDKEMALCMQFVYDLGYDDSIIRSRLVIAFTFADKNHNLQRDVEQPDQFMQGILQAAENRYVIFNSAASDDNKKGQKALSRLFGFQGQQSTSPGQPSVSGGASTDQYCSGGGATYGTNPTELSILIIGKTGNGKSSVGNAILGCASYSVRVQPYPVGSGMTPHTRGSNRTSVVEGGNALTVVDTPDIFNLPEFAERNEKQNEVDSWRDMTKPGPDVILLVVRGDEQYTNEEFQVYEKIKDLWGGYDPKDFTSRLVVAITFLEEPPTRKELEAASEQLKQVLKDAQNRMVVFPKGKEKESVGTLLSIIPKMKNERSHQH